MAMKPNIEELYNVFPGFENIPEASKYKVYM